MTTRISTHSDPARGGKRIELRVFHRHTTVRWSKDLVHERTEEYWRDIGTLMDPVENHVPEQPTNKWKQYLIDQQRAAAT